MKTRLYADEFPAFYTENTAPRSLLPGLKRINTRLSVSTIFFFYPKRNTWFRKSRTNRSSGIHERTSRFDTLFHLERECCNVDVIDNIASLSRAARCTYAGTFARLLKFKGQNFQAVRARVAKFSSEREERRNDVARINEREKAWAARGANYANSNPPITDLLPLRSRASSRDCICIRVRLTRFHLHMHPKTNCVKLRPVAFPRLELRD